LHAHGVWWTNLESRVKVQINIYFEPLDATIFRWAQNHIG
jgi:hypothetical protein